MGARHIYTRSSSQAGVEHRNETLGEAQQYTYTQRNHTLNFDSKGKITLDDSETYEVIFLEGAPYQKRVLHNDKPLSEKDQKKEDEKLQDVTKSRRERKDKKGLLHIFNASFRFQLPLDQLATRFDTTAGGSEDLEGRSNLVFTAVPKGWPEGLKDAAHKGTAYEMKFWIDQQDKVFRNIEAKVLASGMRYEKDSLISYEWKKVNDEAWLPTRFWYKGRARYLLSDVPVETEQTYFDYKKFRADTHIVTE